MLDSPRVASGYLEAYRSINNAIFGNQKGNFTPELIESIPYASQVIRIGKGPQGLVILETKKDNENTWISADGIYLIERNGKIVKTEGLTNNLSELISSIDFSEMLNLNTNLTYFYYVSFSDPDLYNLKLSSTFSIKNKELVTLFNQKINLTLIEEIVKSETLGWEVVNQYWVDDNSFVWKSQQSISPKLPKIYIEVTKKPS